MGSHIQIRPLQIPERAEMIQTPRNSGHVGSVDFKSGACAQVGLLDMGQVLHIWGLGPIRWAYFVVVRVH